MCFNVNNQFVNQEKPFKISSAQLVYHAQTRQKAIEAQTVIGESRPHAILAEAHRLDTQQAQHLQNGGTGQTVAFKLYYRYAAERRVPARREIVEAQVGVYGQTLGLLLVHKRDAVETVLQLFAQRLRTISQVLFHELGAYALAVWTVVVEYQVVPGMKRVETLHQHTPFLGAFLIVLGLYLQEVVSGVHIRSYAQLLTIGPARMVYVVHVALHGIEVHRIVRSHALAMNILGIVLVTGHGQKFLQLPCGGDEFGVRAVHQAYALHFVKGYRLICGQYFVHGINLFNQLDAGFSTKPYLTCHFFLFLMSYQQQR